MANGMPSSRRQISPTAATLSGVKAISALPPARVPRTAAPRAVSITVRDRRRRRGAASDRTRIIRSPATSSASRLVATTAQPRAGPEHRIGERRRPDRGDARSCRAPGAAACSRRYSTSSLPSVIPDRAGHSRRLADNHLDAIASRRAPAPARTATPRPRNAGTTSRRHLHRKARLADSASAGQGHQRRVIEHRRDPSNVFVAADERRRLPRQVPRECVQ